MKDFEYFINENMKVLMIISKYEIELNGIYICNLNQEEIAKLTPCSKQKVNRIIKDLISNEYLEMLGSKGQYRITNRGENVIQTMNKLE